jgi:hypothetical protein
MAGSRQGPHVKRAAFFLTLLLAQYGVSAIFRLMRASNRDYPANGGFALMITLSLMVLLTVIAVGLLSLSAISLRASSRGMLMAQARSKPPAALSGGRAIKPTPNSNPPGAPVGTAT